MRLICPTAFKGTLSPLEAARRWARPGDRILPLSDGGDGFLECLHFALGGTYRRLEAPDPFGRIRPVPVLDLEDGTVVVESAQVIGLAGLERPDPRQASSRGLGELLRGLGAASALWVGLGGTASSDGGRAWPALDLPPALVFCDVGTDLADAAERFGPQKGTRPEDLPRFKAELLASGLPRGPHTGAAGGLGAKLASLGARLVPGGSELLDLLDFEGRCEGCEAVLTGEGRLDRSTLEGKLPWIVARRARALGLPVLGRFGSRGPGWEEATALFDEVRFEDETGP